MWITNKIFLWDLNCRLKYLGASASILLKDEGIITLQVNAGGNFCHIMVTLDTKEQRKYWLKKIVQEVKMKKIIETGGEQKKNGN